MEKFKNEDSWTVVDFEFNEINVFSSEACGIKLVRKIMEDPYIRW